MKKTAAQEAINMRAVMLAKVEFDGIISDQIRYYLHEAMRDSSLMGIRAYPETYKNLVTFERKFRLAEMQTLIDILIGSTPNEIGHTLQAHLSMLEEHVYPLRDEFAKIEKEITDKIEREVNFKVEISKGVPDNKKIFKPNEL